MHLADGNDRFAQIPANTYVSINVYVFNRLRARFAGMRVNFASRAFGLKEKKAIISELERIIIVRELRTRKKFLSEKISGKVKIWHSSLFDTNHRILFFVVHAFIEYYN